MELSHLMQISGKLIGGCSEQDRPLACLFDCAAAFPSLAHSDWMHVRMACAGATHVGVRMHRAGADAVQRPLTNRARAPLRAYKPSLVLRLCHCPRGTQLCAPRCVVCVTAALVAAHLPAPPSACCV